MSIPVHVHLLPTLFSPTDLVDSIAVVIDILRATTTIVHALAAGAREVVPFGEIEAALTAAKSAQPGTFLLGGERHGTRIPGFDLDNSPWSYTHEVMADKRLLFTTTNGTRALGRCNHAEVVFAGAFSNRQALAHQLRELRLPVHLVCAGTDGHITSEDVLFAGSIVDLLLESADYVHLDDETLMALALWRGIEQNSTGILEVFQCSRGGRNLLELGFDRDLERAAECDLFEIVPIWNRSDNSLVPVISVPGSL